MSVLQIEQVRQILEDALADHDILVQVNQFRDQLNIVLNKPPGTVANYLGLLEIIKARLQSLNLKGISTLKVIGRIQGSSHSEWQQVLVLYAKVDLPILRSPASQLAGKSLPRAIPVLHPINPIKLLSRTGSTVSQSVLPQTRRSHRIRNLAIASVVTLGAIYSLSLIGQQTSRLINHWLAGDRAHPLSFLAAPAPAVDYFNWVIEGDQSYIVGVLKNHSAQRFSQTQVHFDLFNDNGDRVGQISVQVKNLQPFETWKFKQATAPFEATRVQLQQVIAH
jgi:hypothetical protein